MGGITFTHTGSLTKTERFLRRLDSKEHLRNLQGFAQMGVSALANATPKDSALAASSWSATIVQTGHSVEINWLNNDKENGFPVAISLQYGYSTGTGGYVRGRDYINPAIKPVFDKIADAVWKEVTRA